MKGLVILVGAIIYVISRTIFIYSKLNKDKIKQEEKQEAK